MPLSEAETVTYTQMFRESPSVTMPMEDVLKLCRDLGWTEKDYPTPIIQSWSTHNGPYNCENFLKIFETPNENAVWKAKYTRDFAKFDRDGNGKICTTELRNYIGSINADLSRKEATAQATDLISCADVDGDKLIDLNEFLSIMLP